MYFGKIPETRFYEVISHLLYTPFPILGVKNGLGDPRLIGFNNLETTTKVRILGSNVFLSVVHYSITDQM